MYIEGHTYACEPCRKAMDAAGIHHYTTSAPPAPLEDTLYVDNGGLFVHGTPEAIEAVRCLVDRPYTYIPDVPTMRSAFVTYNSGEEGYRMVLKFGDLEQLHRAGSEWNKLLLALRSRGDA